MAFISKIFQALARFFRTVLRSCYDMELYRQVRTAPWTKAFAYFVLFSVFLVLMTLVDVVPSSWKAMDRARQYVAEKVPPGATVTVKSGQLQTNLPTPIDLGNDELAVIIDTSVSGLGAQPEIRAKAGFVIGQDVLVVQESATDRRILSLSELPDFSVTKESILSWIDRYGGWVIAAAALFFGAVYLPVSVFGGAVFVLLMALLAAFIGVIWKARLRFGQWVAVGFHAITLPSLANALFDAFGLNVPMVFTFLYFMVIVAVIADERAAPVAAVAGQPAGPSPVEKTEAPPDSASPLTAVAAQPKPARKPAKPRVRKKPAPPAEPPSAPQDGA